MKEENQKKTNSFQRGDVRVVSSKTHPGKSKFLPVNLMGPDTIENPDQLVLHVHHRLTEGQKAFYHTLETYGLCKAYSSSPDPRTLVINIATGLPHTKEEKDAPRRSIELDAGIILYAVISEREGGAFKIVIVGTATHTTYLVIREDVAFSFIIDKVSLSVQDAVVALYASNLSKGRGFFENTAKHLPDFFYKLFKAVFPEMVRLEFTITHIHEDSVRVALYWDPRGPNKNLIACNGFVFPLDISQFPGKQISRGYNLQKKETRHVAHKQKGSDLSVNTQRLLEKFSK